MQAAARRDAIAAAGGTLFATRGFDTTTTAEIARAAGVSAGSVFYYFADKRAVFRAVFERDLPLSRELVDRCVGGDDPVASILAMVDELAADAMHPHASGTLVELLRQVDKDPELLRIVAENAAIVHHGLVRLIERGAAAGRIDATLDPAEAASWIQAVIDGAYLNADPSRDPRPMLRRTVSRFLRARGGPDLDEGGVSS